MAMELKDTKVAIIQVGEEGEFLEKDGTHVYIYPNNTTEYEIVDEIEHLIEFYDFVQVKLPLPPHIRHEVAIAAIPKEKIINEISWKT